MWNGGHHLARRGRAIAQAILAGRVGRCVCCGRRAAFLFEPGIIPPKLIELWELTPELADAFTRKESLGCSACGAKLRAQRIAQVILGVYPVKPPAKSFADWARRPEIETLAIAEINTIEGLHESLRNHPRTKVSDFRHGGARGEVIDGVRHEDLSALTYDSAEFDLVLTSETLEHVPDLAAALAQIRRVLKPSGRHIFTIPMLPNVERTYARSVLNGAGKVEHRAVPIAHPGGDTGYPVFTEFGEDIVELMALTGFATVVHYGPVRDEDVAQVYEAIKIS